MPHDRGTRAAPWALLALALLAAPTEGRGAEALQIRGAYFHHNHERNHLEDLKKHGVDTLLVKFSQLTPDGDAKAVARLKQYARWSRELGLRLCPIVNLMGGGPERAALEASSRRETAASGTVLRKTPCPLDERFWHETVVRRGCLIAQLAGDHAIHAFLIDPEMYGADHTVFDGGGCWCDGCWQEFFKGRGAEAPPLAAAERKAHVEKAGLLDAWRARQSARAEAMASSAREAIHAIRPELRLGVLLLDYPQWIFVAWARGFGTEERPVYAFSETTYSNGFSDYIPKTRARFREQGAFVSLVPGLWMGQFLAREMPGHLVRMAVNSDGYWLYTTYSLDRPAEKLTEGYRLPGPHADYWRAIAATNAALDRVRAEGDGAIPPLVRATALERLQAGASLAPKPPALKPVFAEGAPEAALDAPATRLRRRGRYWILAGKGETIRLRLRGHRLGRYADVPVYVLLGPDGQPLAQGDLPLGKAVDVAVTAKREGVHALHVMSRANTFSAAIGARHWAIAVPPSGLPLCQFARRLYFLVPPTAAKFTVRVSGTGGGEGLLVRVLDPAGSVAAERETKGGSGFSLPVEAAAPHRGKVWSVACDKPRTGIFEDARLAIAGVPPFVSEAPQALLVAAE